jgi:hypothetical protein
MELGAIVSVGLAMAVSFLVFGNRTGVILGAALLVAIALLLFLGYLVSGVTIRPSAALVVQVLFGIAGFLAIGSAVSDIISKEPPDRYTALSLVELAVGVFLVKTSYGYLRSYLRFVRSRKQIDRGTPPGG